MPLNTQSTRVIVNESCSKLHKFVYIILFLTFIKPYDIHAAVTRNDFAHKWIRAAIVTLKLIATAR